MLADSGTAAPGTSPPNARKRYSQSSPIFIAFTPLSMEDDAAIAVSFQKLQASRRGKGSPLLPHREQQANLIAFQRCDTRADGRLAVPDA